MPLKVNRDNDLEYANPVDYSFVATWNNRPLTVNMVSAMMDEAYRQGFSHGEGLLAKVRALLRE